MSHALGECAGQWGMAGVQKPQAVPEKGMQLVSVTYLVPSSCAWLKGGKDRV